MIHLFHSNYCVICIFIHLITYLLIHSLFIHSSNFIITLGEWPPYASYLTLETAVLSQLPLEGVAGPVPGGIIGGIYVRAVYNDRERVMDGCKGQMWCPYGLFRAQALKWSITHTEYIKECRNPL